MVSSSSGAPKPRLHPPWTRVEAQHRPGLAARPNAPRTGATAPAGPPAKAPACCRASLICGTLRGGRMGTNRYHARRAARTWPTYLAQRDASATPARSWRRDTLGHTSTSTVRPAPSLRCRSPPWPFEGGRAPSVLRRTPQASRPTGQDALARRPVEARTATTPTWGRPPGYIRRRPRRQPGSLPHPRSRWNTRPACHGRRPKAAYDQVPTTKHVTGQAHRRAEKARIAQLVTGPAPAFFWKRPRHPRPRAASASPGLGSPTSPVTQKPGDTSPAHVRAWTGGPGRGPSPCRPRAAWGEDPGQGPRPATMH